MPYVKCSKCHHEWETVDEENKCDWCGAPVGKVLEKKTPLERMLNIPYVKCSKCHYKRIFKIPNKEK